MKNKTTILAIILTAYCSCLLPPSLKAQDIHFSQFFEDPSNLNPALIGAVNATRGALNYKDQWRSVTTPYQTVAGSYEMRFNTNEWEKVPAKTEVYKLAQKRMAGGISFFSDRAGDGNMGLSQVQLSLSSAVPLSSRSVLSVGLQGGYSQRSVNYSKLIFPEQYNGTGYDPTSSTGENFGNGVFYHADFAGGLLYAYNKKESKISANDQFKCFAGVSIYHFNRPRQSFLDNGERMYARQMIHANFEKGFKQTNVSILPSFMVALQGPSKEIIFGGMVKYKLRNDTKYTGFIRGSNLLLGAYYRNSDALIACFQMEFGNYGLGFSYDINTSPLHTASNFRGGFEIMLKFVTPNPFLYQARSRM